MGFCVRNWLRHFAGFTVRRAEEIQWYPPEKWGFVYKTASTSGPKAPQGRGLGGFVRPLMVPTIAQWGAEYI